MDTTAANIVEAALKYASYGWHVVPLKPRDKIPIVKGWQRAASIDEDQIIAWWEATPKANCGVQLGRRSNIIDIEADTANAEKEIVALFDGESPICPTFQARRGRHRIFRWRSDLPGGAVIHAGEIEVRLGNDDKGAQSVFPPSVHKTGNVYRWLEGLSPDEIDPPPLGDGVIAKLWNLSGDSPAARDDTAARSLEHWDKILAGSAEGDRNVSAASFIGHILRNAADLYNETAIGVLWMQAKLANAQNRPPLPEGELRQTFTGLLKRELNRRTGDEASKMLPLPPEQRGETKGRSVGDFRLVRIESDPPRFELHAPFFSAAKGGCVVLNAKQMASFAAIKVAALEQANYPLPDSFRKAWNGKDGLYEKLVFGSESHAAAPEEKRTAIVADRLLGLLSGPRVAVMRDDETFHAAGGPRRTQDGMIVFDFTRTWEELSFTPDKVTRPELCAILSDIGAEWVKVGGKRYKGVGVDALVALTKISES